MQWLLSTMIGNAAVAAGLAVAALVAMKLRRPAAAHVWWLLVIVKLLTPPVWQVEVMAAEAAPAASPRHEAVARRSLPPPSVRSEPAPRPMTATAPSPSPQPAAVPA